MFLLAPLLRSHQRTHAWSGNLTVGLGLAIAALALAAPAGAQALDDATILALELEGPEGVIRADPDLVAAIDAELALIRAQLPQLAAIHVLPSWVPGELMVRMTDEALAELQAGTFTGFDALFAEYPVVDLHFFTFIPWVHITFAEPLHPLNLAPLVLAVDGVTAAEPNGVAGDGPDITIAALGSYTFRYGWGDCPAGCMYSHYWQVAITDGVATVVAEWGDDLPVAVEATSWSALKAGYR